MANFSYQQNYGVTLTSPFISSPYVRADLPAIMDKFRTARTRYTISAVDCKSPFISGQFSLLWDIPYADVNYTYSCTLREITPTLAGTGPYAVGPCSPSVNGLTGYLSVGPVGRAGDVVGIDIIAIHD